MLVAQLRHVLAARQSAWVPEEHEQGAVTISECILERNDIAMHRRQTEGWSFVADPQWPKR